MGLLTKQILDGSLIGKVLSGGEGSRKKEYTIAATDNFAYKDPIDHSVSTNQVREEVIHYAEY